MCRAKAEEGEELVSGVIKYSALTKTPLFIPNTSCNDFYSGPDEHKSYPFYSYVDYSDAANRKKYGDPVPVIPGSEIRGMFRSNFEILTNSCLSALDSDMKLSKRTMESYKAGLLRRVIESDGTVQYDLYQAKDVLWRTMGTNNTTDDLGKWERDQEHNSRRCYIQDGFAEGEHVNFVLNRRHNKTGQEIKPLASEVEIYKKGKNKQEGYMIKGEESPGGPSQKHCCHIFMPITFGNNVVQENVKISLLDDLLEIYRLNQLENASLYKEYSRQYHR